MPNNIETLRCLSVTQPIGTFYLTVMTAGELLKRVDILRRGLTLEERNNVQRQLNTRRRSEIATYVTDPDATFPTSIIVSAYARFVHIYENGTVLAFGKAPEVKLEDEDEGEFLPVALEELEPLDADAKVAEVIDGQHRLEGLKLAGAEDPDSPAHRFELPVVFMLKLDAEDRAYVFSTINSKQTPVPSSLIYDLFGLSKVRGPKRTCHEIARTLNAKEGSPFYQTLKMLGKKTLPTESLTQGSFAKYLLTLISRRPDEDTLAIKTGKTLLPDPRCPLREFFIDGRDDMIAKILENYFDAVREAYPTAWRDSEAYAMRRTVGFAALIKAFRVVWDSEIKGTGKATRDAFRHVAEKFHASVPEDEFRDVPSNEGGANVLARKLTRSWTPDVAPRT